MLYEVKTKTKRVYLFRWENFRYELNINNNMSIVHNRNILKCKKYLDKKLSTDKNYQQTKIIKNFQQTNIINRQKLSTDKNYQKLSTDKNYQQTKIIKNFQQTKIINRKEKNDMRLFNKRVHLHDMSTFANNEVLITMYREVVL